MGLMSFIATRFGTVIRGKYVGCKFGIGSSKKGISTLPNQFLFIKGFKEIARIYAFKVEEYTICSDDMQKMVVEVKWEDGESSVISLPKLDSQGQPWQHDRVKLITDMLKAGVDVHAEDS